MAPGQVWAHNFATSRLGSFRAHLPGSTLHLVGRDLVPQEPPALFYWAATFLS